MASRVFLGAGVVILMLHLYHMFGHSKELYTNFELTHDFALYAQAYHLAGTSNFNPASTMGPGSFLRNHFEITTIIFAILTNHFFSSYSLLALQDLAVFGTNMIILLFAYHLVAGSRHWFSATVVLGTIFALGTFLSPWNLEATTFDFHAEVVGGFFVMGAVYLFWRQAPRLAAIMALLAILSGTVTALYIFGAVLGVILSRRFDISRPAKVVALAAAVLAAAEIGGVALTNYENNGYLAGFRYLTSASANPSFSATLLGIIEDPLRVVGKVVAKIDPFYRYALSGGLVWFGDPLGIAALIFVFGPPLINGDITFISSTAAFQIVTGVALFSIAALLVLARFLDSNIVKGAVRIGLVIVSLGGLAWGGLQLQKYNAQILAAWGTVTPAQAQVLDAVLATVPDSYELVVSQSVVGRFAAHPDLFNLSSTYPIAINRPNVEAIIVPVLGNNTLAPSLSLKFIANLTRLSPNAHIQIKHGIYIIRLTGVRVPTQVSA